MSRRTPSDAAFTLVEVLVAILIVAVLVVFAVPNFRPLLERAQAAICASQMRSIRVATDSYLNDHDQVWPQGPSPEEVVPWAEFWLATLAPYGIKASTWHCPTIKALMNEQGKSSQPLHYVPTMFDATPGIARRWSTQPWLVEIANAHGQGALVCFPDGSVKSFNQILREQGL